VEEVMKMGESASHLADWVLQAASRWQHLLQSDIWGISAQWSRTRHVTFASHLTTLYYPHASCDQFNGPSYVNNQYHSPAAPWTFTWLSCQPRLVINIVISAYHRYNPNTYQKIYRTLPANRHEHKQKATLSLG